MACDGRRLAGFCFGGRFNGATTGHLRKNRSFLVTAFMVNFDRHQPPEHTPWGTEEWEFFLAHLARNHMKDDGRLVMLLNDHTRSVDTVTTFLQTTAP